MFLPFSFSLHFPSLFLSFPFIVLSFPFMSFHLISFPSWSFLSFYFLLCSFPFGFNNPGYQSINVVNIVCATHASPRVWIRGMERSSLRRYGTIEEVQIACGTRACSMPYDLIRSHVFLSYRLKTSPIVFGDVLAKKTKKIPMQRFAKKNS